MRAVASWVVVAVVSSAMVAPALAQPEDPVRPEMDNIPLRPTKHSREITVEIPGERSSQNKWLLRGLGAVTVIAAGAALYYHLDSRSTADAVSANTPTGIPWSSALQSIVDDNDRSRSRATIGYVIGGSFLIGLIVTYIATNPPAEQRTIYTTVGMRPIVTPTAGGATVGAGWSF